MTHDDTRGAPPDEIRWAVRQGPARADREVQRHGLRVGRDARGLVRERDDVRRLVLHVDVRELRTVADDEVDDAR